MKNRFFILMCFLFSLTVFSQEKKTSYNALLWRISGNGLLKPSYVFGTMHITDNRVFHFTDSLYASLESCEGFAAELDISNVFTKYLGEIINTEKNKESKGANKFLKDSVDKKLLDKYKAGLEKRFRKPLDEIRISELDEKKDEWIEEMLRKGDMQTFMDAYLFELAKRQGKWVGGIEDPEDQFGLDEKISIEEKLEAASADKNRERQSMEWMINTYLKQDLDAIDRSENIWQGTKDIFLSQRNKKMARRIDSLGRIRTTLFAIGAAHIPGDEGVINLLRKKGFVVTPVYSKIKIAPEDYEYKKANIPWSVIPVSDSSFTIQMPGEAEKFSMYNDIPIDMKFYLDMGSMRAFFTMAIPAIATDQKSKDSLMQNFADRFAESGKKQILKNVLVNGFEGKELVSSNRDAHVRVQVFITDNFIAINLISAYKRDALSGDDAEKFFTSFRVMPSLVKNDISPKEKWQNYTFDKYGFSVDLPAKYRIKKDEESDEAWDEETIESIDFMGNSYYGIRVSTVKKGYYSDSDSALFENYRDNLVENMHSELISERHFLKEGYPAYEATLKGESEGTNICLRFLCVNRGARRYFVFTTTGAKKDPELAGQLFFNSFSLLPPSPVAWKTVSAPDKSFSTWSPGEITFFEPKEKIKNEIKYYVEDPATKYQVFIDKNIFPRYYWTENDSTLFKQKINTFYSYKDSVLYYDDVINGGAIGVDLLIKLPGTHNVKKMRVLLNGDTLYTIYSYLPGQSLQTRNYEKLFDDLRINSEVPHDQLYKRKPAELLKALRTTDSLDFEEAKSVFEEVEFIKDDIPLLQQSLLCQYFDFDTSYYYNTNSDIAVRLERLDSNYSGISFIRNNYRQLDKTNEYLKPFLLGLLSDFKTQESYKLLKELIIQSPPLIDKAYYFRNKLTDSLDLTVSLYPEILSLSADPGLFDFINDLTLTMLDSNKLETGILRQYKKEYLLMAERILALSKTEQQDNSYQYHSLIKLLGKINDDETNTMLTRLGEINDRATKLAVILALVANHRTPDKRDIYSLATTDEYRSDLYDGLKELRSEGLFPGDYLSQRYLGQSVLFNYASDDDAPELINYLGERIATFMGKKQKFYLFKVYYDVTSEESCYLGVAGPYSLRPTDFKSTHDATGLYWDQPFDASRTDEFFKDLLKRTEEWLKDK